MNTKRILASVFITALLSFAGVPSASAQGTTFTYQGRLIFNGASANGNLDLTFKLYDDAVAGNQIGSTLTNFNLSVVNGLVTVRLDFGASAFPGADRWLQIGVRTNGSADNFLTLSPRQPLTSAPYAIQAASFTGSIQDAQLSANVARLDGTNAFTGVIKNVVGGTEFFMVPRGGIIIWSGAAATVPAGWALCDGNNGTPDLRDRFVVGAAGAYAVGDLGGAASHTHDTAIGTVTSSTAGAHAHTTAASSTGTGTSGSESGHTHSVDPPSTATGSAGSHTHGGGTLDFAREVEPSGSSYSCGSYYLSITSGSSSQTMNVCWNGATASGGTHTHSINIASFTSGAGSAHTHSIPALSIPALGTSANGDHTHAVAIGTVTATSADSRPPFYALCYIMKL
jgi:hypothetical protein